MCSSQGKSDGACLDCDIAAIVLNWRTADLAVRCIESILGSHFSGSLVVIFVDNNSGDGSFEHVRAVFDGIETIQSGENRGYAGGMNIGLSRAIELRAKYAFLVNADVEVEPSALWELYDAAEERPGGAIFGPRIFDIGGPGDTWMVGGRWDWLQGTVRIVREHASDALSAEPREIEFVNGSAMLVRMSAIEKVGMFDERFGLYFEETDLCSRMKKAGYTLWHVPRATVHHVCGASISKTSGKVGLDLGQYYRARNRLLWGRNNLTGLRAMAFWWNILWRWPCKLAILMLRARLSESAGLIYGVADFIRGRYGILHVG